MSFRLFFYCVIKINDCINLKLLIYFITQMKNSRQSKEIYSNKSGLVEKKSSNLVIKTQLQNTFDNRWAEIKIEGKNIPNRSNHIAVVFGNSLFVHGGYDVDRGVIGDFYEMDISEKCQQYKWKLLNNLCENRLIKLKSHTGVIYKHKLILFGGEIATNLSNNTVYIYDFESKKWSSVSPKDNIPKVDSHCALMVQNKMLVYGGYISEKAEHLIDILAYDADSGTWQIVHKGEKNQKQPQGRSNFSMVEHDQCLLIFGGTDGVKTLNDMWVFSLKQKNWLKVQNIDTPEPRRGHSMVNYQSYIFMFGGIQNVTKQKNDIYIYQFDKAQWNKIHATTNSVYDCSPTLKKSSKKSRSPELISPVRISPQKQENPMKKILIENKQKKFQERKRQLLKQFSQSSGTQNSKKRNLSPTTESMVKTLETIGNQQSSHKELKQQIIYDDSHRYIIGKKPCARDGQSVSIYDSKMYIFGGDRHLMAFNDLYQFDLEKGVNSLEVYKH